MKLIKKVSSCALTKLDGHSVGENTLKIAKASGRL